MSAQTELGDRAGIDEHEDVHVEVEQVSEDVVAGDDAGCVDTQGHGNAQQRAPAPRRTIIFPHQRAVLEEFFRTGMTSAAMHLSHLHQAAAERTQLDLSVIKNWIRNRRRPTGSYQQPREAVTLPSTHPSSISAVAVTVPQFSTVPITVRPLPSLTSITGAPPEPKRVCIDMPEIVPSGSPVTARSSPFGLPLVVKARLAESGESDFVEVEVEPMSFQALLRACCEELEVSLVEVSKIRKLPNVIVRKDRDVQRMKTGQELELVLKAPPQIPATYTINPYATVNSSHTVQLLNVNPIMSRDIENGSAVGDTLTDMPLSNNLT